MALHSAVRVREVARMYRGMAPELVKNLQEATATTALQLFNAVTNALVEPWRSYVNRWKGGRPRYWTRQLKDLRKRNTKAYNRWRRHGCIETWGE